MDRNRLEYAIVKYGTPLYVFDLDMLEEETERIRRGVGPDLELCYALKANPFLAEKMAELAGKLEICSMGEYRICKALEIPPEKFLISGVLKKEEEIEEILCEEGDRCIYTIESPAQFSRIGQWCETHKKKVTVYLRLSSGNQFGMDQRTLESLFRKKDLYPGLCIKGLHYFSGTQKRSPGQVEKELVMLDRCLNELENIAGEPIETLEYGPGIPVPYFTDQKDETDLFLQTIQSAAGNMRWKGQIVLEMGRALAAGCGYYLTQVLDVKKTEGTNYCIVDGGIHQINYDGQIRGMYRPHLKISPFYPEGKEEEWTVCGALCTAADVLVRKAFLKNLRPGSILIFERAGAYAMTEGMALFLSRELPAVAVYERKEGWRLFRDRTPVFPWNMEDKKTEEKEKNQWKS